MKKFLGILALGLLLSGNAYAKDSWTSKNTLSMHEYLASGWKLHSTHSFKGTELVFVFILQKDNKIIYCKVAGLKEKCFQSKRNK